MISFRARASDSLYWEEINFSGEQEELLAHLFGDFLHQAGWEFLTSTDGGEFEELDWEDSE
jgi:hypothetical protein